MSKFAVVLHKKDDEDGEGNHDAFYTQQNFIVGRSRQGMWMDFDEAQKAAQRARIQDPLGRRVTVNEY